MQVDRESGQLGLVPTAELLTQPVDVGVHGGLGQIEPGADLLVGHALRDHDQDVALPSGEVLHGGRRSDRLHGLLQEQPVQRSTEIDPAVTHRTDRVDQGGEVGGLADETPCSVTDRGSDQAGVGAIADEQERTPPGGARDVGPAVCGDEGIDEHHAGTRPDRLDALLEVLEHPDRGEQGVLGDALNGAPHGDRVITDHGHRDGHEGNPLTCPRGARPW